MQHSLISDDVANAITGFTSLLDYAIHALELVDPLRISKFLTAR